MKIYLKTEVIQPLEKVVSGFNDSLFMALSPPFPKVILLRFDGSKAGDTVSLELNFILFKQKWTSQISESNKSEGQFYFIDEGTELPFPLKKWRHKHVIKSTKNGSIIIDDIDFGTNLLLLDVLIYPFLLLQFIYRKPIYRRIFGQN